MGKYIILSIAVIVVLLLITSCSKQVGATDVTVVDPARHYYPMVTGEKLNMVYTLNNDGDEPFVIMDVQPSCGCIVSGNVKKETILPGDSLDLHFTFDASKNVGYVAHKIRVYGNSKPNGIIVLSFDVNVVSPSGENKDYEEIYNDKKELMRDATNGEYTERGYYVGDVDDSY